jgi:hypothetical protein
MKLPRRARSLGVPAATHSMGITKWHPVPGKEKADPGFSMLLQSHTYPEMLSAIRA